MWEDQILWRDVGRTMRVAFSSVTSEVEKLATREVMGWGQGWPAAALSSSLCHAQSPSMCSCAGTHSQFTHSQFSGGVGFYWDLQTPKAVVGGQL